MFSSIDARISALTVVGFFLLLFLLFALGWRFFAGRFLFCPSFCGSLSGRAGLLDPGLLFEPGLLPEVFLCCGLLFWVFSSGLSALLPSTSLGASFLLG